MVLLFFLLFKVSLKKIKIKLKTIFIEEKNILFQREKMNWKKSVTEI